LLWLVGGALGWAWLTKPADDPETGAERTTGRLIWAAAAVLGVAWAAKGLRGAK
jgi:hypothetical protein